MHMLPAKYVIVQVNTASRCPIQCIGLVYNACVFYIMLGYFLQGLCVLYKAWLYIVII